MAMSNPRNRLIASPCVSVIVGINGEKKKFFLHEELLFYESEKFRAQFQGGFSETTTRCLPDCEEDVELFRFFVEYLYRDGWVSSKEITHQSEYVNLARIYSMGERLRAERFQKAVLWKFATSFSSATIPDQAICELLEIVCTELPELSKENGLRDLVFWYAASKLSSLKKYNIFQKMMQEMPDLGRYICMRAGNGTSEPPRNEVKQPTSRFPAELDVCLPRNQLNSNLDC